MLSSTSSQSINITLQALVNLQQSVAALFGNLAAYTPTYAATITQTIEAIKAQVVTLPFTTTQINEIINVLNQAEVINNQASAVGFITTEQLNTILNLLQLASQKVSAFSFSILTFKPQRGCGRGVCCQRFTCTSSCCGSCGSSFNNSCCC